MKKQVIVIHGGETFETYEDYLNYLKNRSVDFSSEKIITWKDNLGKNLGEDFQVVLPQMPNNKNAKYLEWKIWFERLIPFFEEEVVLLGHSLGGIFLAKYLSENDFPKKIKGLFLVAPPYEIDENYPKGDSLADFIIPKDFKRLLDSVDNIFLYHSTDDDTVPFSDLEKYKKALVGAKSRVFKDRGHIWRPESFKELEDDIKSLF
jgi:predicted alpha/beta hydrolase family esterase